VKEKRNMTVDDWLNRAKELMNIKTERQLALKLDVTRQAVRSWRDRGEVPPARAAQIEYLTKSAVTWQSLCPELLRKIRETDSL